MMEMLAWTAVLVPVCAFGWRIMRAKVEQEEREREEDATVYYQQEQQPIPAEACTELGAQPTEKP